MPNCNSSTQLYWNGPSFVSATAFFTDPALTQPAADGWYAFGLVVRQVLNGVLLTAVPCNECVIPCGQPFIFNGGVTGQYTVLFNMAAPNPGAGVITFSSGVARDTYFPIPDQCEWAYDGKTSSEYSTMQGGYIRGLMGGPDVIGFQDLCLRNQTPLGNSFTLTSSLGSGGTQVWGEPFTYDISSGLFSPAATNPSPIPTAPPFVNMANTVGTLGWTGLSNNGTTTNQYPSTLLSWNCQEKTKFKCGSINNALGVPDSPYNSLLPIAPNLKNWSSLGTTRWPSVGITYKNGIMVVPSPAGVVNNIMTITVSAPCTSTWWAIDVTCPEPLTPIFASTEFGDLEPNQSQAGQDFKTPLETTLKGSGTTSCGFITNCLPGLLICETPGVDFNDPTQFPPNGIQVGDLVKDPVTGYFANITNVTPLGNVLTIVNANASQNAVAILEQTQADFEVYRKGVCEYTIDRFIYHVPVDAWGNSNPNSFYDAGDEFPGNGPTGQIKGVLGLGDWVFSDISGEFPLPVGVYKMRFDAQDGNGVQLWAVQVGPREYKDTSLYDTGTAVVPGVSNGAFISSDPPEDYVGQLSNDNPAGANVPLTFLQVQRTGARKSGIVRSITPCIQPIPESFDCIAPGGNCVDPGTGLGAYSNLVDCQNGTSTLPACTPDVTYNCVSGACIDPGTGLGTYNSLFDCQNGTSTDPACIQLAPCAGGFTTPTLNAGQHNIDIDLGTDTGAVIIRFQPYGAPDRCTWTYDGVTASEYSSATNGYLEGLIGSVSSGNQCGGPMGGGPGSISNTLGSNGFSYDGEITNWDPVSSTFIPDGQGIIPGLMGPFNPQNDPLGDTVDLVANPGPGFSMMVIPKPNAFPGNCSVVMDGPCGSTAFIFEMNCPQELPEFQRGDVSGTCAVYTDVFYAASPLISNGLGAFISLHDWVFTDKNGEFPLPPGQYPALQPGSGLDLLITVSSDGIITQLIVC